MNKRIRIFKPSILIQSTAARYFTLTELQIVNYLVYVVKRNGEASTYLVSVKELKEAHGLTCTLRELASSIDKFRAYLVRLNILNKDRSSVWGATTLLTTSSCLLTVEGKIHLRFSFTDAIKDSILRSDRYTTINLMESAKLKSSYAYALYENLLDWAGAYQIPYFLISDLRMLLSPEGSYKEDKAFLQRVVKKATTEITSKTDFICYHSIVNHEGQRKVKFTFIPQLYIQKVEKSVDKISDKIMLRVPVVYQGERLNKIVGRHLTKGLTENYIICAIGYTVSKKPSHFFTYLDQCLSCGWSDNVYFKEYYADIQQEKVVKEEYPQREDESPFDYNIRIQKLIACENGYTEELEEKIEENYDEELY